MSEQSYKVFTINPGSTSTKVALFEGDRCVFSDNIAHDQGDLAKFPTIADQYEYRKQAVLDSLARHHAVLDGVDAFASRGGGIASIPSGVFAINDKMLSDLFGGEYVMHPANNGARMAREFSERYGGLAIIANGPTTDEFQDVARLTGLKGVYRHCYVHTLNQKEVAIRYAAGLGRRYEDLNLVIAHIGGGVSVTAHRKGRMIDSNDIASGDGPMAPTRSGALPVKDVVDTCFSGRYTEREMDDKILKRGGFVDHLNTSDTLEVKRMIERGDRYAALVYEAFCYQIGKAIGSAAAVLHGEVDQIILTGGIAHDADLTDYLVDMCGWIAPVTVVAGDFEQEALAAAAVRALEGKEPVRTYTGEPVWNGFFRSRSEAGALMQPDGSTQDGRGSLPQTKSDASATAAHTRKVA